MRSLVVVAVAVLSLAAGLLADEKQRARCPVEVIAVADDGVGQRLVFKVKEDFRSSQSFCDATPGENHVQLIIRTMDRSKGQDNMTGYSTMYAVIWLLAHADTLTYLSPSYITSTIGFCGTSRLDETAEELVAHTDETFGDWAWPPH